MIRINRYGTPLIDCPPTSHMWQTIASTIAALAKAANLACYYIYAIFFTFISVSEAFPGMGVTMTATSCVTPPMQSSSRWYQLHVQLSPSAYLCCGCKVSETEAAVKHIDRVLTTPIIQQTRTLLQKRQSMSWGGRPRHE
eukprot:6460928-Amphidinium_carterae.1